MENKWLKLKCEFLGRETMIRISQIESLDKNNTSELYEEDMYKEGVRGNIYIETLCSNNNTFYYKSKERMEADWNEIIKELL